MEIYPLGKTTNSDMLIEKLAQQFNTIEKTNFPFEFSETPNNTLNYPADKIGGFAQVKNHIQIPNEIYVNKDDIQQIGIFVLNLLTGNI